MSLALAQPDPGFAAVDLDELERAHPGDGPVLRYRWYEALASLRYRSYPGVPFNRIYEAISIGEEFVEYFAAQAEAFGCQPVHILKPPPPGENRGGGLAWRWTEGMRPIGFGPRLLVAGPGFPFVYRLERTGEAPLVYGAERIAALQALGIRERGDA